MLERSTFQFIVAISVINEIRSGEYEVNIFGSVVKYFMKNEEFIS